MNYAFLSQYWRFRTRSLSIINRSLQFIKTTVVPAWIPNGNTWCSSFWSSFWEDQQTIHKYFRLENDQLTPLFLSKTFFETINLLLLSDWVLFHYCFFLHFLMLLWRDKLKSVQTEKTFACVAFMVLVQTNFCTLIRHYVVNMMRFQLKFPLTEVKSDSKIGVNQVWTLMSYTLIQKRFVQSIMVVNLTLRKKRQQGLKRKRLALLVLDLAVFLKKKRNWQLCIVPMITTYLSAIMCRWVTIWQKKKLENKIWRDEISW